MGWKVCLSLILAAVLGWHVWSFLDSEQIPAFLEAIRPGWLLAALLIFLLYQLMRAFRFRLLVGVSEDSGLSGLFDTMCLQGFFNFVLPAGLGEPVLVVLLRRLHRVDVHRGAASLVAARLSDLMIFSAVLPTFAFVQKDDLPVSVFALLLVLSASFPIALAALLTATGLRRIRSERPLLRAISEHVERFVDALGEIRGRRIVGRLLAFSTGMWVCIWAVFYCTVRALGSDMSWLKVIALYLLQFPVYLLPIKGVGGVGTHHAAWFYALRVLDLDASAAALLAFGSHLVFLGIAIATALVPFLRKIFR